MRKKDSSESKKLPKNFANKVLDYELKIDSGQFDIQTIDKLMQLYSVSTSNFYIFYSYNDLLQQAVEYYSGMNDEKYMYFTERIQNTLLKPEILKLMKDSNDPNQKHKDKLEKELEIKKEKEKCMTAEEKFKQKQKDHEKRKKERVELLQATQHQEILEDPQFKKDRAAVQAQKETV